MQDRQVGGLGPFEDSPDIDPGLTVCFQDIGAVADEAAGMGEPARFVDRGDPMAGCQSGELIAPRAEDSVRGDDQPAGTLLHDASPGRVDLALITRPQDQQPSSQRMRCLLRILHRRVGGRAVRVDEQSDGRRRGHQAVQDLQLLRIELIREYGVASGISPRPMEVGDETNP